MAAILRILIVENDAHIRDRMERVIGAEIDIRIIGTAETKSAAKKLINTYPFETLVIDLTLPDGFGLEIVSWVNEKYPESDVMILANSEDDPHIVSAIEAGATGYVLKSAIESDLINAVRLLQAGGSPVSPNVAKSVLRALCTNSTVVTEKVPTAVPHPLSERETEILRLLAKGMSFNEIGNILAISPHTVTAHIKKIYRKLQVHSRGEAVYEAAQMGIIP